MNIRINLILLTLIVSGFSFGQNAGEYMDNFSVSYSTIQQDMWDYTNSVAHGKSARNVEKRRNELIQSSNTALNKAKTAKAFNGSTRYRDSIVEYFRISNIVLKEDYAKIVDMEAVAEESYDAMEAYMLARERANDKLAEAGDMVEREQKLFAKENDVNLIESTDPVGKKMEVAGKVYEHYNEVYLIFFKSFKQEAYLIDAVSRGDVNAIEQNRSALESTAKEGIEKLANLQGYAGDNSMIAATTELLKFYIQEAGADYAKVTDYFMKTENFNKVKTSFDQKKQSERTQKDVDAYNKSVKEMNEAVGVYNQTNTALNTKRGKLIDTWNTTAQKFTDKHVPKGKK